MKAIWNGVTIAESDDTIVLEGNYYFPRASVVDAHVVDSPTHTTCPWKGQASYISLQVNGELLEDAGWYYPSPSESAQHIQNRVAFWKGVEVIA